MHNIRAWSIQKQMLVLGILPALLMFVFLSSYFVMERLEDVNRELKTHGQFIAEQLAPASEYSIISGNVTALKKSIMPLLNDPQILYITISDVNNQVLLHAYGKFGKTPDDNIVSDDNRVLFAAKIIRQSLDEGDLDYGFESSLDQQQHDKPVNIIGEVLVAMSTIGVKNRQKQILLASSLPAALTLLMTIIMALTIGGITAAPIIRLSQVARKIKQGDYSVRVEEKMGGEIGSLEVDINEMAEVLQESRIAQENLLEQMRIAREQAESASLAKSDFLAMMSHELRTPMNGVLGMLQLMEITKLTEEQSEYASIAIESANHLLTVINDILDFSRIERGKLEIELVYFDLKELVENCVRMLRYELSKKNFEFKLEYIGEFDDLQIKSDPTRIRQILVNLLSNAIKFTEKGSVTLRLKVNKMTESQLTLFVEVEDTGTGIPQDKHEKIFSPFLQADSSTSRRYGGTGLGLSIARQLATLLNGSMMVTSTENIGSLFICQFFVQYYYGKSSQHNINSGQYKTINNKYYGNALVVEDNAVNQMVAVEMLKLYGIKVETADDGQQACEKFRKNKYDYIFMDLQMPRMDGVEATRVIRKIEESENRKRTPIIALTANALLGEKQRCLASGMDDYLTKPFQQIELKEKLDIWHFERLSLDN